MRESVPLSLSPSGQQKCSHARRQPHTDRIDWRSQVLHRVIDRQSRGDAAAWRIDVHVNITLWIVCLEKEQLSDDDIRDVVVDGSAEADDAIHEQARKDVIAPLATARSLDHIRGIQRWHGFRPHSTVFLSNNHLKTFSSVRPCSISFNRPAFWSEA